MKSKIVSGSFVCVPKKARLSIEGAIVISASGSLDVYEVILTPTLIHVYPFTLVLNHASNIPLCYIYPKFQTISIEYSTNAPSLTLTRFYKSIFNSNVASYKALL